MPAKKLNKNKTQKVSRVQEVNEKVYCRKCQKTLSSVRFYKALNSFIDVNGFMSICKDCCNNIYEHYHKIHETIEKAVYLTCEVLDIKFSRDVLDSAKNQMSNLKNKGSAFGIYKSKLALNNSSVSSNNLRFKDSDLLDTEATPTLSRGSKNINNKMIEIWGKGLDLEDYHFLNKEYKEWTNRYKCSERAEEILFKQICYQILDINKSREDGYDVAKKLETLQKLMDSANVRPKDANALSDSEVVDSYGVRIKDIEMHEPAEYFEDRNLYRDFSGIEKYLKDWVLRPMKNLLKGTRDFNVDEEEDINDTPVEEVSEDGMV